MTRFYYKKSSDCIHGKPKNEYCPVCEVDNVYIKKDLKSYNDTYDRRKLNHFALAFHLKANFKKWEKRYKGSSIDSYLYQIKGAGKLKLDPNTLKHAYYVARNFPGLENTINRKMSFSAYSEIANAYLTSDQKMTLRKEMEEKESRTVREIRETIRTRFRPEKNRIREKFSYIDQESFLENIKDFLNRNPGILPQGSEIILTAKPSKNLKKA